MILSQSDVQDILKGAASSGPCDVNLKVRGLEEDKRCGFNTLS